MGDQRRLRRLTAGDATWLWTVRHQCDECHEVLSLHPLFDAIIGR